MPIRHVKGPGVVARTKIYSRLKPHYIFAYLWESSEAMVAGGKPLGSGFKANPEWVSEEEIAGMCTTNVYDIERDGGGGGGLIISTPPLIAEVHFIQNEWDIEVVSHEVMHAISHRMRCLPPFAQSVHNMNGDAEETICHELGEWVAEIWEWLFKVNHPDQRNA